GRPADVDVVGRRRAERLDHDGVTAVLRPGDDACRVVTLELPGAADAGGAQRLDHAVLVPARGGKGAAVAGQPQPLADQVSRGHAGFLAGHDRDRAQCARTLDDTLSAVPARDDNVLEILGEIRLRQGAYQVRSALDVDDLDAQAGKGGRQEAPGQVP